MVFFDHCYTNDPGHRFLKKLQQLGFSSLPNEVEHPGRHHCRFIAFKSKNSRKRQYMEFVNVKLGGVPITKSGISFGSAGSLEKLYGKLAKKKKYGVGFSHKNYDWKQDRKTRNPGWNFVQFKKLGFRGFYPWFTEYEVQSKKRKAQPTPPHANGVTKVLAIEFCVNEKGRDFFRYLFGKDIKDKLRFEDGTEFYFLKTKRNSLNKIILKNRNLDRFIRRYDVDEIIFRDQRAALIRNPSAMWDIVIV